MEAAAAVCGELRRVAGLIESESARRVRVAQRALSRWSGPYADTFADELRRRVREADALAAACRRAALTLEQSEHPTP
jgi:hypothetical protein